jgi:hypothetical protein
MKVFGKYYLAIVLSLNLLYTIMELIRTYKLKFGMPYLIYYAYWQSGLQHGGLWQNVLPDSIFYLLGLVLSYFIWKWGR